VRYQFVKQHTGRFPVAALCRVMQVTRSGYYAWRKHQPSERHKHNETLRTQIRTFFERSKQTYGSPRILRDLREAGFACGKHQVARLMRQAGLRAVVAPRFRVTTDSKHCLSVADNLLARDFSAPGANVKWAISCRGAGSVFAPRCGLVDAGEYGPLFGCGCFENGLVSAPARPGLAPP
jgi:hypothetical protein